MNRKSDYQEKKLYFDGTWLSYILFTNREKIFDFENTFVKNFEICFPFLKKNGSGYSCENWQSLPPA